MDEIRFYSATGNYGFLSNLYKRPVTFESRVFPTAEHAYQFGKPRDPLIAEWIVSAPYPRLVATAGHAIRWRDQQPNWNRVKVLRMRAVLEAKFNQHPDLAERLLATGNAVLIENSPVDIFWGIGNDGTGKNMLGVLLMEVRQNLQRLRAPSA